MSLERRDMWLWRGGRWLVMCRKWLGRSEKLLRRGGRWRRRCERWISGGARSGYGEVDGGGGGVRYRWRGVRCGCGGMAGG